ncbi:MAG: inositol monophosphatase family protein [Pseudomonadota bacterium]
METLTGAVRDRAVALTREAGAIAMRHFRSDLRSWEKTPGAVVTEADLAIDRFLRERLPAAGEAWLSEESADDRRRLETERVWIVDPIDGTRSFVAGRPEFAISVALWSTDRIVLGIVFNPATDELFVAEHRGGLARNGIAAGLRPWQSSDEIELLVSGREAREVGFDRHFATATVRRLGSLAYRVARVASGRADGVVSLRTVADWDLAAAALMVEEGGGRITDRHGHPLRFNAWPPSHDGLVVAAPPLHDALHDVLERIR